MSDVIEGEVTALAIQPAQAVLPAMRPEDAKAAMNAYLDLCNSVLESSDYQEFEQWDPKVRAKVQKRFKKKSAVKKLQTFFSVTVRVREMVRDDLGDGHFGFRVIATAETPGGRMVEATGACATHEERFDVEQKAKETDSDFAWRRKKALARSYHDVLSTAETRATNRAVMNCIGVGGGEVTADEISRTPRSEPRPAAPEKPPKRQSDDAEALSRLVARANELGAIPMPDGPYLLAYAKAKGVVGMEAKAFKASDLPKVSAELDRFEEEMAFSADVMHEEEIEGGDAHARELHPMREVSDSGLDVAGAPAVASTGPAAPSEPQLFHPKSDPVLKTLGDQTSGFAERERKIRGDCKMLQRELEMPQTQWRFLLKRLCPGKFVGMKDEDVSSTLLHEADLSRLAAHLGDLRKAQLAKEAVK